MVDLGKDGTDDTPIQPVSSLRSHFEHMIDQKSVRPPITNFTQKKQVSEHLHGHSNDESHAQSSTASSREASSPRSALKAHGSKILSGDAKPFGEPGETGANDLKTHQIYSPLQQRPLSVGLSRSIPSPPALTVDVSRSPTRPPLIAKRKLTHQPLAKAATPSPPQPQSQPRPFNSFRSPSDSLVTHSSRVPQIRLEVDKPKFSDKPAPSKVKTGSDSDYRRLSNPTVPPKRDVYGNGEVSKPQLGNKSLVAQSAAGNYHGTRVPYPPAQLKEYLPSDSTRLERRNAEAGHREGTSRSSLVVVDKQDFRPELPPRQVVEKPPGQLPQVSSRPPYDRTWTDHRDGHKKTPSKQRVPSAPQPSWSNSAPSQSEPATPLRGHHNSNRSVHHIDRTKIVPQTQNNLTSADNLETPNIIDSASRSETVLTPSPSEYPDTTSSNRRPPFIRQGVQMIQTNYDTKLFEISNRYLCTSGYLTKAWDLTSGEMIMSLSLGEKEIRVTALAFKPGPIMDHEGVRVWLGTNFGDLYEVDILTQAILYTQSAAHSRREIIKVFRYQSNMWTLGDDGRLNVWQGNEGEMPSLEKNPRVRRIPKGHSFSILIQDTLWIASGTGIRIFRPNSDDDAKFFVREEPLSQPGVGEITSGAIIPGKLGVVYFGHADGKVTSYSTQDFACLGVFNVSLYKINCLAGAGSYIWAGYSNGMIYVYDTNTSPWKTKKDWQAHDRPVTSILVDLGSIWQPAQLQVASIGTDNTVRLWDGILGQDWLENEMHDHEIDYCSFRKINATIMTWNAGASTPASLRYDEKNSKIFVDMFHVGTPSDLLVFGFQELVDLDDKKLTAKNIFKGNKKKDSSEQEHMSRQYRAWRDYLVRCIEDHMPAHEPYQLLHTASMVGLFSCVFVKASQRHYIDHMNAAELKRGLGGLHGNKGALILRFVFDDTSLCFMNCHLAAGQSQTTHRNNDASAILEAAILPSEPNPTICCDRYVGGGDGSMVLDHEICVLNGDLNYRIETMGRETVIKAIDAKQYHRLLERDQLLVSRRRNPGFRLRDFQESPILFAPTYKYDIGTDHYDTSEKHRTPAWCDRILYRGSGKVEQLEYQRHELQISDHRPVSGIFAVTIKRIIPSKRTEAWEACEERFGAFRRRMIEDVRLIT